MSENHTFWPATRDALIALVALGEEAACSLTGILREERKVDPEFDVVPVSIPDLDFDAEQLVLDALARGCVSFWLLLPADAASHEFAQEVTEALNDAGHPWGPMLSLLPEGWDVEDLVAATAPTPGAFIEALRVLWLAAGPSPAALKQHVEDLASPIPQVDQLSSTREA